MATRACIATTPATVHPAHGAAIVAMERDESPKEVDECKGVGLAVLQ